MDRTGDARLRVTGRIFATLMTAATAAASPPAQADVSPPPPRVMSIDQCANQYLLALADRDQILSLVKGGDETTLPFLMERSEGIPRNHRTVEEIIAERPDILLSGPWSEMTAALAKRFGIRIVRLDAPRAIASARRQITDVARMLGHEDRGQTIAGQIDRQLADAAGRPASQHLTGVVYRGGGYAYGSDTLVDSLMTTAGIDNVIARLGQKRAGTVEMEALITARPAILLDDQARDLRSPRIATDMLAHPALRRALPDVARIQFPMAYWLCGGATVPLAIDSLSGLVRTRGQAPGRLP
ncbi:MAG: ABC transporter substrate-binding protein [Telmatospirillum sp.]|nr:ABC transporter substrate-binding protein [Telmatospirillum sp.]